MSSDRWVGAPGQAKPLRHPLLGTQCSLSADHARRQFSLSPKAILEASPPSLQPYLRLIRFDKPIGECFCLSQSLTYVFFFFFSFFIWALSLNKIVSINYLKKKSHHFIPFSFCLFSFCLFVVVVVTTYISLSVLSLCLCLSVSVSLSLSLFQCLSVCQSVSLSLFLSLWLIVFLCLSLSHIMIWPSGVDRKSKLCWDCNTECHVPMAMLMT